MRSPEIVPQAEFASWMVVTSGWCDHAQGRFTDAGKLALERDFADPAALIQASLDGMKVDIEKKGLQLKLDLGAAGAPVWMDPIRFQQVFWNIAANAVKFSVRGGVIEVTLNHAEHA